MQGTLRQSCYIDSSKTEFFLSDLGMNRSVTNQATRKPRPPLITIFDRLYTWKIIRVDTIKMSFKWSSREKVKSWENYSLTQQYFVPLKACYI